jgi:hypothetical protein
MDEEELLWWFWRFSMMCHEVHHSWGKALAASGRKRRVSAATKKQLYRAWLEDWDTAGQAPMAWQMTDAQSSGDVESLLELYEQAGITPSRRGDRLFAGTCRRGALRGRRLLAF